MSDRVLDLLDEAKKWLHKQPYTEESHRMVVMLQGEAQTELDRLVSLPRVPTPIEISKAGVPAE